MFPSVHVYTMFPKATVTRSLGDCSCGCHQVHLDGELGQPAPQAVEHGLCQQCAKEAFTPWTQVLDSIST